MENFTTIGVNKTVIVEEIPNVIRDLWIIGIAVSCIGLVIQLSYFTLVPPCRKYDEKVLCMMTTARLINTIMEYTIVINTDFKQFPWIIKFTINLLYFQSDFALVCWMFVFTKNLYDKVVLVFTTRKFSFVNISYAVWIISFFTGLVAPFLLMFCKEAFRWYYNIYVPTKLIILVINGLIFIEIFSVACPKGSTRNQNVSHVIKTAVISFIMMFITSLHVFTVDLLAMFVKANLPHIQIFYIVNSFQIVLITLIFFILARKKARDFKRVSIRTRVIST